MAPSARWPRRSWQAARRPCRPPSLPAARRAPVDRRTQQPREWELETGLTGRVTVEVDEQRTARWLGSGDVDVWDARGAGPGGGRRVRGGRRPAARGRTSVGTWAELEHLAATPVGRRRQRVRDTHGGGRTDARVRPRGVVIPAAWWPGGGTAGRSSTGRGSCRRPRSGVRRTVPEGPAVGRPWRAWRRRRATRRRFPGSGTATRTAPGGADTSPCVSFHRWWPPSPGGSADVDLEVGRLDHLPVSGSTSTRTSEPGASQSGSVRWTTMMVRPSRPTGAPRRCRTRAGRSARASRSPLGSPTARARSPLKDSSSWFASDVTARSLESGEQAGQTQHRR